MSRDFQHITKNQIIHYFMNQPFETMKQIFFSFFREIKQMAAIASGTATDAAVAEPICLDVNSYEYF